MNHNFKLPLRSITVQLDDEIFEKIDELRRSAPGGIISRQAVVRELIDIGLELIFDAETAVPFWVAGLASSGTMAPEVADDIAKALGKSDARGDAPEIAAPETKT